MAAHARPQTGASGSRPATPGAEDHNLRKRRSRQPPEGSCNYRDIEKGLQAQICGCVRFWSLDGAELHCTCGHHACFHKLTESFNGGHRLSQTPQQAFRTRDGYPALDPQSSFRTQAQDLHDWQVSVGLPEVPMSIEEGNPGQEHRVIQPNDQSMPSLDSGGLPPYPSMLLLDGDRQRQRRTAQPALVSQTTPTSAPQEPSLRAGLGLYYQGLPAGTRVPSPSPTIADQRIGVSLPESDSQIPSTRQASTTDDPRQISPSSHFLRRMLESRAQVPVPLETNVPIVLDRGALLPSATEAATPNAFGTPAFSAPQSMIQTTKRLLEAVVAHTAAESSSTVVAANVPSPNQVQRNTAVQLQAALQSLLTKPNSLEPQDLTSAQLNACIKSVLGRLDSLENASFAHVTPSVFQENHEMVDTRLIDMEQQLSDQLRRIDAIESTQAAFGYGADTSLASNTSSAMIVSAIDRMDVDTRLDDMETRLLTLEATAPPSARSPWEVEVVLIPWGRLLGGIWLPASAIDKTTSANMTQEEEEDWQQSRNLRASSRAGSSFRSTQSGWSSQAIHAWARDTDSWLSAKACGTNSIVYHRLRSRGLVRTVTIKSAGAHAIRKAICDAFGLTLGTFNGFTSLGSQNSASEDDQDEDDKFLGLKAPFIPLRKKHKLSRLRFLTPAEMTTSALWTSDFLSAGIMMRAAGGQKRLFVTTREAYMQESSSTSIGWTWDRIRNLPVFTQLDRMETSPDDEKTAAQLQDATASEAPKEPCWAHHHILDSQPSSSSASFASFHSHVSTQIVRREEEAGELHASAQHNEGIPDDQRTVEYDMTQKPPRLVYQPITPISEFPTQISASRRQGLRQRTVSMPATETASAFRDEMTETVDKAGLRPNSAGKRRLIQSFEATNNPLVDLLPSFVPKADVQGLQTRKKRKVDNRLGKRRQRSVSWDLPAQQSGKFEVDADELDHYRRHLSRTNSALTATVLRADLGLDSHDAPSYRVRKPTPSFFQPTPVSRVSDTFLSSQARRRARSTTEEFLADLQAMDAKGVCQEIGCDHVHCTTSEGSQDGRAVPSSSKGRGNTPFAYATPFSGPIMRSREDNDTIIQALMESSGDEEMTGIEFEDNEDQGEISDNISDDVDDENDENSSSDAEEEEGASRAWSGMLQEQQQCDDSDMEEAGGDDEVEASTHPTRQPSAYKFSSGTSDQGPSLA